MKSLKISIKVTEKEINSLTLVEQQQILSECINEIKNIKERQPDCDIIKYQLRTYYKKITDDDDLPREDKTDSGYNALKEIASDTKENGMIILIGTKTTIMELQKFLYLRLPHLNTFYSSIQPYKKTINELKEVDYGDIDVVQKNEWIYIKNDKKTSIGPFIIHLNNQLNKLNKLIENDKK